MAMAGDSAEKKNSALRAKRRLDAILSSFAIDLCPKFFCALRAKSSAFSNQPPAIQQM
jgi:hypothetical protein